MTAQLPFEALFAALANARRAVARVAGRAPAHKGLEDKMADFQASKDAEFEDFFDSAPNFSPMEEPCAEPDMEPAPLQESEAFPERLSSGPSKRGPLLLSAAVGVVFLVVAFASSPTAPLPAPPPVVSLSVEVSVPQAPPVVSVPVVVEPAAEDSGGKDIVAKATEEAAESESQVAAKEDSIRQVNDPSSHYTVPLTRSSFPVSKVGDITYYRSAYFGTVHVGSPAVPYKVVFDTGSGHLILPSTYCQSETCRAHRRYRRSDSSTARDIDYDGTQVMPGQPRDQITVSFGTGEVTGVFVEDIVCMHDDKALQAGDALNASTAQALQAAPASGVPAAGGYNSDELERGCMKLRLIAATQMSEEPFKSFQFDGVLGLGLDGLSQAPEFNFIDIIASAAERWGGQTPHTFAVFLAEDSAEESKITFGGWDEDHLTEDTKDLSWQPVLDPEQGHWTIRIKALRIDGEELEFCHSGCKGVVDTGTSLLAVPVSAFSELYTMLRHPAHMEGHCHGPGPQLHIELDSFTITLGPEDYARVERPKPRKTRPRWQSKPRNMTEQGRADLHCKPMLMSMDLPAPLGPKLFILGEPILRKYYSVYDGKEKRVGFGRALHFSKYVRHDMTPAPKRELAPHRSMFDVFRWRKIRR